MKPMHTDSMGRSGSARMLVGGHSSGYCDRICTLFLGMFIITKRAMSWIKLKMQPSVTSSLSKSLSCIGLHIEIVVST